MYIDWNAFSPCSALAGGALIGLAATALMLFNGQLAGISGILARLLTAQRDNGWRWSFVAGLLLAALLAQLLGRLPSPPQNGPWLQVLTAGLLVGLGTGMANGCTSGHGICGLARLSRRSLAATATFMLSAMATVYLLRQL